MMKITLKDLRKIIREESSIKRYWGRGGAGILFTCSEDDTVLLLKRAAWVQQGGTWGIPGGAIEDGYYAVPIEDPLPLNFAAFFKAAKREVVEECGSMPRSFTVVGRTVYEDRGFRYVTFVVDVPLNAKEKWMMSSSDSETDEFVWFPAEEVHPGASLEGTPLHFGVSYTLTHHPV